MVDVLRSVPPRPFDVCPAMPPPAQARLSLPDAAPLRTVHRPIRIGAELAFDVLAFVRASGGAGRGRGKVPGGSRAACGACLHSRTLLTAVSGNENANKNSYDTRHGPIGREYGICTMHRKHIVEEAPRHAPARAGRGRRQRAARRVCRLRLHPRAWAGVVRSDRITRQSAGRTRGCPVRAAAPTVGSTRVTSRVRRTAWRAPAQTPNKPQTKANLLRAATLHSAHCSWSTPRRPPRTGPRGAHGSKPKRRQPVRAHHSRLSWRQCYQTGRGARKENADLRRVLHVNTSTRTD
jgi:hypothetical protein